MTHAKTDRPQALVGAWLTPAPKRNRPPLISWMKAAVGAKSWAWRVWMFTMLVPNSMVRVPSASASHNARPSPKLGH